MHKNTTTSINMSAACQFYASTLGCGVALCVLHGGCCVAVGVTALSRVLLLTNTSISFDCMSASGN